MELEINKVYTTKEMKEFFGVSDSKWKKEKDLLLKHLADYYLYEVEYDKQDARKRNYIMIEKKADYKEYNTLAKKEREKRDSVFEREIIEVIESDNLQTAKNISRIIDGEIKKEFGYTSGTIYEYTRLRVNEWFGKGGNTCGTKGMITEKIWCYLDKDNNCYMPLSEEQIKKFYNLYGEEKNEVIEYELSLLSDCENGIITKDVLLELIGECSYSCFTQAKKRFKLIYGYYPIKVPVYEIGVFSNSVF